MTSTHNVESALWKREREFWTGGALASLNHPNIL